ncbi:putative orf58-like protein [Largemouth bass virus]|uniref:Orf58-like protein n=2 Tax=Largemouth bass virus TaxID=176656 RepID=A0A9X7TS47_9VIRU|nr:putative orf58-like protein [Largemouth bass virus]
MFSSSQISAELEHYLNGDCCQYQSSVEPEILCNPDHKPNKSLTAAAAAAVAKTCNYLTDDCENLDPSCCTIKGTLTMTETFASTEIEMNNLETSDQQLCSTAAKTKKARKPKAELADGEEPKPKRVRKPKAELADGEEPKPKRVRKPKAELAEGEEPKPKKVRKPKAELAEGEEPKPKKVRKPKAELAEGEEPKPKKVRKPKAELAEGEEPKPKKTRKPKTPSTDNATSLSVTTNAAEPPNNHPSRQDDWCISPVSSPPRATSPVSSPPRATSPVSSPPRATSPVSSPPRATSPVSSPPRATSPVSSPPRATSPTDTKPKRVRKPKAELAEGEEPKPKRVRKPKAELAEGEEPKPKRVRKPKTELAEGEEPKPKRVRKPKAELAEGEEPKPKRVRKPKAEPKPYKSKEFCDTDDEDGESKPQQEMTTEALMKLTIAALKDLCRTRGINLGGNKAALVNKLVTAEGMAHIIPTTATVVQKVKKTKRPAVFSKIETAIEHVPCPDHEHILMDEATKLIFLEDDPSTAIGFINNGELFGLDSHHMNLCKNMGIRFSWNEDLLI